MHIFSSIGYYQLCFRKARASVMLTFNTYLLMALEPRIRAELIAHLRLNGSKASWFQASKDPATWFALRPRICIYKWSSECNLSSASTTLTSSKYQWSRVQVGSYAAVCGYSSIYVVIHSVYKQMRVNTSSCGYMSKRLVSSMRAYIKLY